MQFNHSDKGNKTHYYLHYVESLNDVGDECQNDAGCDSKLPMKERIVRLLEVGLEGLSLTDHPNDICRACNVKNFHHGVV